MEDFTKLNAKQLKAIPLLVAGEQVKDVAAKVGVNPATISVWRQTLPFFVAAENRAKMEVLNGALGKLQSLVPKALQRLEHLLEHGERERDQLDAARSILQFADVASQGFAAGIGPTNPKAVIDEMAKQGTLNPANFGPEQAKELAGKVASFMDKKAQQG